MCELLPAIGDAESELLPAGDSASSTEPKASYLSSSSGANPVIVVFSGLAENKPESCVFDVEFLFETPVSVNELGSLWLQLFVEL